MFQKKLRKNDCFIRVFLTNKCNAKKEVFTISLNEIIFIFYLQQANISPLNSSCNREKQL